VSSAWPPRGAFSAASPDHLQPSPTSFQHSSACPASAASSRTASRSAPRVSYVLQQLAHGQLACLRCGFEGLCCQAAAGSADLVRPAGAGRLQAQVGQHAALGRQTHGLKPLPVSAELLHAARLAPIGCESGFCNGLRQLHDGGVGQEVPRLLAQRPHHQRTPMCGQPVGDQAENVRSKQRRGGPWTCAGKEANIGAAGVRLKAPRQQKSSWPSRAPQPLLSPDLAPDMCLQLPAAYLEEQRAKTGAMHEDLPRLAAGELLRGPAPHTAHDVSF
jgi:hypothetical protein